MFSLKCWIRMKWMRIRNTVCRCRFSCQKRSDPDSAPVQIIPDPIGSESSSTTLTACLPGLIPWQRSFLGKSFYIVVPFLLSFSAYPKGWSLRQALRSSDRRACAIPDISQSEINGSGEHPPPSLRNVSNYRASRFHWQMAQYWWRIQIFPALRYLNCFQKSF